MRFRGTTIRRKIVALLLIPLVSLTAIWVFAATITTRAVFGRPDAQRIANNLVYPIDEALNGIQQERKVALLYIANSRDSQARIAYDKQQQATDSAIAKLRSQISSSHVRGDLNSRARRYLDDFLDGVGGLAPLRQQVDGQHITREATYAGYNTFEAPVFQTWDSLYPTSDVDQDSQRAAMNGIARAGEELSREDALMGAAISTGHMSGQELTAFVSAVALERGYFADYTPSLATKYRTAFDDYWNGVGGKQLRAAQNAISVASATDAPIVAAHQSWPTVAGASLTQVSKLDVAAVNAFTAKAEPVPTTLVLEAVLAGGLGLIAVAASLIVSVRIGRGLIRDLTGLRREAQELSGTRLPRVMRRLAAGEQIDVETEVPKLEYADDEVGQVGQALNVLQRAAVEAAVRQSDMRKGVSDVFVNLARRSQVLLHRQLTLLDSMERRTEQPDELADLFRLDHMTTRMRRHAEGLVILSGAAPSRQWRKPVQLMDVVRAAVAEVEDYERIDVVRLPKLAVSGAAVADLTHLLAELIENAAVFSPPHTQVRLHGEPVVNGFVLEIDDRGLGMSPDALLESNLRLAETPEFELSDTDRLGLFVVSRLAQRHNVRVSLRQSPYGGTTAVVLVPAALLSETDEETGGTRVEPSRGDGAAAGTAGTAGGRVGAGAAGNVPRTESDTEHTFRQWGMDGIAGEPHKEHTAHPDEPAQEPAGAPEPGGPLPLPRRRHRVPTLVSDHGRPVGPAGERQQPAEQAPADPTRAEQAPTERIPGGQAPANASEGTAGRPPAAEPAAPQQPAAADLFGPGPGQGGPLAPNPNPGPVSAAAPAPAPASAPAPTVPPARRAAQADAAALAGLPPSTRSAVPASAGPPASGDSLLPRRVRQASLAPQLRTEAANTAQREEEPALTERSAEEVRDRMAALQRGWQRGRAADPEPEPETENGDQTSTSATRTTPEGNGR